MVMFPCNKILLVHTCLMFTLKSTKSHTRCRTNNIVQDEQDYEEKTLTEKLLKNYITIGKIKIVKPADR